MLSLEDASNALISDIINLESDTTEIGANYRKSLKYLSKVFDEVLNDNSYSQYQPIFDNIGKVLEDNNSIKKNSIGYLLIALMFLFKYKTKDSRRYLGYFKNTETGREHKNITISLFKLINQIEKYKADYRRGEYIIEIRNSIALICGIAQPNSLQYHWQWDTYNCINQSNISNDLKPKRKNQVLDIKNFVLPQLSCVFSTVGDLINIIPIECNFIIFFGHGDENGDFVIELNNSKQNSSSSSAKISLNEILIGVGSKFEGQTIILFNCNKKKVKIIQNKNNVIFFNGFLNFRDILPFTWAFFFNILYSRDVKLSFEFGKTIAILFSDNSKNFEFIPAQKNE